MQTALHKTQTDRPRGKMLKDRHNGTNATKPRTKPRTKLRNRSTLETALKMLNELNRDNARNKARCLTSMKNMRVNAKVKGGKVDDSGNQNLQRHKLTRLARLAQSAQSTQTTSRISRKVSICPIKRSVASLEMNVPTGKWERVPSVSTLGSDDSSSTRYSVNKTNRTNGQPPRAQRAKVTTVATPVIKRSLTPQVDKQSVETHRIAGTDLCVSAICKNLVTDIVSVFGTLGVDKMPVDSLLQHLCADSTKPWSTYQGGEPIGARQLNRVLTKELGVHSYDIRVGVNVGANGSKTVKGLHRRVFELLQVLLNAGTAHPVQHPVDATHTEV